MLNESVAGPDSNMARDSRSRCLRAVVLMVPSLLAGSDAFGAAGPPLVTDDPGTAEKGTWEINLASTYEERHGQSAAELPLLDFNYGLGERVQFKYEVPWVFAN